MTVGTFSDASSNIIHNYNIFKTEIEKSIKKGITYRELFSAVCQLEIVDMGLKAGDENPQLVFESINSTGVSLSEADLIRNYILMNCDDETQKRWYSDYWHKIETNVPPATLSEFFADYLRMKTDSDIKRSNNRYKYYEEFKKYTINNEFLGEPLLQELLRFSKYYYWFISPDKCKKADNTTEDAELTGLLNNLFYDLDSNVYRRLLLFVLDSHYHTNDITREELIKDIEVLIAYTFRRWVCGYQTRSVDLTSVGRKLKEIGCSPDILLEELCAKKKTQVFPRDSEFIREFTKFEFYKGNMQGRVRYTLYCFESLLHPKVKKSVEVSIEHIMPQTLKAEWKSVLGEKADELHERWLNTIGNLTLTAYNSEMSNNLYVGEKDSGKNKKKWFADSEYAITRAIAGSGSSEYATSRAGSDNWLEADIIERAKDLATTALKIWNLPSEYNNEIVLTDDTEYNIDDDVGVTSRQPDYLVFCGAKIEVDSCTWKEALLSLAKKLYEFDTEVFEHMVEDGKFKRLNISSDINSFRDAQFPVEVIPGLYMATKFNAGDILSLMQEAARFFEIESEVYYHLK